MQDETSMDGHSQQTEFGGKVNTKVQWTLCRTETHPYNMELGQERRAAGRPLVSVVDDDESVRESLPDLLGEFGFAARPFSSAEEFLASDCVDQTRCLILDIAMPGMSGPELQRELKIRRREIPIIFITAQQEDPVRPQVLEQGAIQCLFKPFSDTALLEAVNSAFHTRSVIADGRNSVRSPE
jgi:FixJ family two-component response regulator